MIRTSLLLYFAVSSARAKIGPLDIGNIRPEGVHLVSGSDLGLSSGTYALVSQILLRGIDAVDIETGEKTSIVPSDPGVRTIFGLAYDNGYILAAGGGALSGVADPLLFLFSVADGNLIASCGPTEASSFVNDVVVVGDNAYATDSIGNRLLVMDLAAAKQGVCNMSTVPLPDSFVSLDGSFAANGIIPYHKGFLVVHSTNGSLFYVDLTDNSSKPVLPVGSAVAGDGLSIADDGILYITEGIFEQLSAWQMTVVDDVVTADFVGYLTCPTFDMPSTSDVAGDVIYSVNKGSISLVPSPADGEFDVTTFAERFRLVGIDRFDYIPPLVTTLVPTSGPTADTTMEPTMEPTMGPTSGAGSMWWRPAMMSFVAASCLYFRWM
jgi:hypothetical protein